MRASRVECELKLFEGSVALSDSWPEWGANMPFLNSLALWPRVSYLFPQRFLGSAPDSTNGYRKFPRQVPLCGRGDGLPKRILKIRRRGRLYKFKPLFYELTQNR